VYTVLIGKFGKLHRFHRLSGNHLRVFEGHHVSEHHGSRTVWSGRGDKDLQVDGFCQGLQE
jgi:hypothetical protein